MLLINVFDYYVDYQIQKFVKVLSEKIICKDKILI